MDLDLDLDLDHERGSGGTTAGAAAPRVPSGRLGARMRRMWLEERRAAASSPLRGAASLRARHVVAMAAGVGVGGGHPATPAEATPLRYTPTSLLTTAHNGGLGSSSTACGLDAETEISGVDVRPTSTTDTTHADLVGATTTSASLTTPTPTPTHAPSSSQQEAEDETMEGLEPLETGRSLALVHWSFVTAYVNEKLARKWKAGEPWALTDRAGLVIGTERVADIEREWAVATKQARRCLRHRSQIESLVAESEREWLALRSIREKTISQYLSPESIHSGGDASSPASLVPALPEASARNGHAPAAPIKIASILRSSLAHARRACGPGAGGGGMVEGHGTGRPAGGPGGSGGREGAAAAQAVPCYV